MGTPKGESSRSRGGRSRGGDRRPEATSQTVRTAQSESAARGGRGPASGVVEHDAVIEAHGTDLGHSIDTELENVESVAGESQVLVSKPVEIADRAPTDSTATDAALGSNELLTGDSANSNHRADIVQVPPSFPEEQGHPQPAPARSTSRRDHAARLEAASVLDAPASLHESVSPPSGSPWALRLWVAAMLGIIGTAGVVAMRERAGQPAPAISAQPMGAPSSASAGVVPPAALVAPESEKKPATVTAVAPALAPTDPAKTDGPAKGAATAPLPPPPTPPVVTAKSVPTESALDPALADDTPEGRARARRAARRAAELAGSATQGTTDKPRSSGAKIPASDLPPLAPALNTAAVRDPSGTPHAVTQIPGNPYESEDDSLASGAP